MERGKRPLILTWLALLALLVTSAGSAWLPLGWLNSAISLGIACAKALLVALVFMRLRQAHALLRLAAVAGLVTLVLLFGLAGADYATRSAVPAPWQAPATVAPRLGALGALGDTSCRHQRARPSGGWAVTTPGGMSCTLASPASIMQSCSSCSKRSSAHSTPS